MPRHQVSGTTRSYRRPGTWPDRVPGFLSVRPALRRRRLARQRAGVSRVHPTIRRRLPLVAGMVVALSALSMTPAQAATQYIHGGEATFTSTTAKVCARGNVTYVRAYYTESEVPGQEIGGQLTATSYSCITTTPVTGRSRFRSFHVCNSLGSCGPEVRL